MLYPTELRARPFSDCTPQNSPQKSLVREGAQFALVFHSPFATPSFLKVFKQAQPSISFEQATHFHGKSALRRCQPFLRFPNSGARDFDPALAAILATDVAIKESRVSTDEQLLESLVLTLCVPARQASRSAA